MPTYFEKLSDKQLLEWYYAYCKNHIKNNPILAPKSNDVLSRQRNDVYNIYAYGNCIKIVYIKNGKKLKYPDTKINKITYEKELTEKDKNERFSQSVSRSRSRIFELAMCNEFKYFCTFTQDKSKRNRFDLFEFRKDFTQFIRNQNRFRNENEKIKYLLIPEQHKDGAWHMHGLLSGLNEKDLYKFGLKDNIPKKIKDKIKSGENIYNWYKYHQKFGYFTCTEIKDKSACSKYITKYVSKDLQKTVHESGEHLFFASKGLKSKEIILKNCYDKCPIEEWDYENDYVKIKEIYVQ